MFFHHYYPTLFIPSLILFIIALGLNIFGFLYYDKKYTESFYTIKKKTTLQPKRGKYKNKIIELISHKSFDYDNAFIYNFFKTTYDTLKNVKGDNNAIPYLFFKNNIKLRKDTPTHLCALYIDKRKNISDQIYDFIFFFEERKFISCMLTFFDLFRLSNSKYLSIAYRDISKTNGLLHLRKPQPYEEIYLISTELNYNSFKHTAIYNFFTNTFFWTITLSFPLFIYLLLFTAVSSYMFLLLPIIYIFKCLYDSLDINYSMDDNFIYIKKLSKLPILYDKKNKSFLKLYYNYINKLNPYTSVKDNKKINENYIDELWFKSPRELYRHAKFMKNLNNTIVIQGYPLIYIINNFKSQFNINLTPYFMSFLFRNFKSENNPFKITNPYNAYKNAIPIRKTYSPYDNICVIYAKKLEDYYISSYEKILMKLITPFIRKNKLLPTYKNN